MYIHTPVAHTHAANNHDHKTRSDSPQVLQVAAGIFSHRGVQVHSHYHTDESESGDKGNAW